MDQSRTTLDEAYTRLRATGPEFQGWLSNHGPMVAEAMIRHGHQDTVHSWLDTYTRRLEPFPVSRRSIGPDWRNALGDIHRVADWAQHFEDALAEQPWRIVLNVWWPRLLPGIAAGATHGVIRVGHAVRALLRDGESPRRLTELAQGLAYWAARWQPMTAPSGFWNEEPKNPVSAPFPNPLETILDALARTSRVEAGGFDEWVGKMNLVPEWSDTMRQATVPRTDIVPAWLAHLVDVAVFRYLRYGHGNGIMLVHSATAPNAVLRTLPVLERRWWRPSALAAWIAAATLTALYAPSSPYGPAMGAQSATTIGMSPLDAFAMPSKHRDEHVIKFADTALDVYARTSDSKALAAIYKAGSLIQP